MKCKNCGLEYDMGGFCPGCGTYNEKEEKAAQKTEKRFCPECGQELREDMVFCPNCGRKHDGNPNIRAEIHNVQGDQQNNQKEQPDKNIFLRVWNSDLTHPQPYRLLKHKDNYPILSFI